MIEIYVIPLGRWTMYIVQIPGHNVAVSVTVHADGEISIGRH